MNEHVREISGQLEAHLNAFIAQKQALGYKYYAEEESLRRFLRFVKTQELQSCQLTKELIDSYGNPHQNETSKSRANRISDVRQFMKYLNNYGVKAYIPMPLKKVQSDFKPYIFTSEEVYRIIIAADSIKPHSRYNCAEVYPVLFRMLYGCGLRISEALDLRVSDVNLNEGTIVVRSGKFNKSRMVVMAPSLTGCCVDLKQKIHPNSTEIDFFFKNRDGSRRSKGTVSSRFKELLWESDIPYRGKGYGPRLHDLRHSFCCHSLKQMSDAGIDLYCALPVLSAYVGHSSISATEQYLRLTEQFYPDITGRVGKTSLQVYPEVYKIEAN